MTEQNELIHPGSYCEKINMIAQLWKINGVYKIRLTDFLDFENDKYYTIPSTEQKNAEKVLQDFIMLNS